MDKARLRRLNLIFGIALSVVLLWLLYGQVQTQLAAVRAQAGSAGVTSLRDVFRFHPAPLAAALLLLPLNIGLEAWRWQRLASVAQPLSFGQALASYLAGIAGSVITPNRIGEYPARILFLKRQSTYRLATVAVLGAAAQLLALFLFGALGFAWYLRVENAWWARAAAGGCALGLLLTALFYFRINALLPRLQQWRWTARFVVYGGMLMRFSKRESRRILLLTIARSVVFTAQYVCLLRGTDVMLPAAEGFCAASLFFWAMAVIPTIALAELGLRGQVSLALFGIFSANTIGILSATLALWGINLVLPALAGSLILWRVKLVGSESPESAYRKG